MEKIFKATLFYTYFLKMDLFKFLPDVNKLDFVNLLFFLILEIYTFLLIAF